LIQTKAGREQSVGASKAGRTGGWQDAKIRGVKSEKTARCSWIFPDPIAYAKCSGRGAFIPFAEIVTRRISHQVS
jgi:hypothetical protein